MLDKLMLYIDINRKENGVVFTKTSEPSERLPLPHTKGTKPAP